MNLPIESEKRFKCLEKIIEKGMTHFIEVGTALSIIRDEKLYKMIFRTFEEYCKERWGFAKSYAYYLVASAKTIENLKTSTIVDKIPTSESQVRPFTHLPLAQQKEVWKEAIKSAPQGKVTAKHVEKTVKEYFDPQTKSKENETTEEIEEDEDTPTLKRLKQCWSEASRSEKTIFVDWLKKQGEF